MMKKQTIMRLLVILALTLLSTNAYASTTEKSPTNEPPRKIITTLEEMRDFPEEQYTEYQAALNRICEFVATQSGGVIPGKLKRKLKFIDPNTYDFDPITETPFGLFLEATNDLSKRFGFEVQPLETFYAGFACPGLTPLLQFITQEGGCLTGIGALEYFQERVSPEVLKHLLTRGISTRSEQNIVKYFDSGSTSHSRYCPRYFSEVRAIINDDTAELFEDVRGLPLQVAINEERVCTGVAPYENITVKFAG